MTLNVFSFVGMCPVQCSYYTQASYDQTILFYRNSLHSEWDTIKSPGVMIPKSFIRHGPGLYTEQSRNSSTEVLTFTVSVVNQVTKSFLRRIASCKNY